MALVDNQHGGIDLLATVKELDARVTAIEGKHLVVTEEQPKPEAANGDQASESGQ
jgi:hypothetical protein